MTVFLTRSLAVLLLVIAHAFLLNLGNPPGVGLGFAYAASVVGLAIGAILLWRRTME